MPYQSIPSELIQSFTDICGKTYVLLSEADRSNYAHDETEDHHFMPELVLKPGSSEEIAAILKLCNQFTIPVTPRGGGTGLSGAALPIHGGVIISMERFNKILHIDTLNLQVTVEPGVITEVLQNEVKALGLFYPPDPSSRGSCFIGGNLAHNSGGPKAVKYGVTRDYVLNMEIVTAQGEITWTGANVLKNSTGYNLTQLMCGSEGTLGIITKIVLKLRPYPTHDVLMLAAFPNLETACKAISAIYLAGVVPSGMELIDRLSADLTQHYVEELFGTKIQMPSQPGIGAYLLIELDGNNADVLFGDAALISDALVPFVTDDPLFADSAEQKDQLWKLRRQISPAVNSFTLTKAEDVVVPRGKLPELVNCIHAIGKEYGYRTVCFGHAGDGNLHLNILKEDLSDAYWNKEVNESIGKIFAKVVELGGTLSGEHGIGIAKKPFMELAVSPIQLELMKGIKKVFDPNNILNPGKIF
jgi:glycolate oxidase